MKMLVKEVPKHIDKLWLIVLDSGGPLAVMRGFQRPVLNGVVSWGRGCGQPGYPGIYTSVAKFRGWLRNFLSDEEQLLMDAEDVDEFVGNPSVPETNPMVFQL